MAHPPLTLQKAPGLWAPSELPLLSQGRGGTICKLAPETSEFSSH